MIKRKIYKYFGRNGVIMSLVDLDYQNRMEMYQLTADKNKILTDGEKTVFNIVVEEKDLNKWTEEPYEADINE